MSPLLVPHFPALIAMVKEAGSPSLKEAATALDQASTQERLRGSAVAGFLAGMRMENHQISAEYAFFAHALLQPFAEYLAERTGIPTTRGFAVALHLLFADQSRRSRLLRPEGDGAKRFLLCSLCATEWLFRRVLCPNCAEENKDKLPIFLAQEFDYVRIDACDTCHTYIKSIDLTKNGNAVPMVDELATVSLNLWAQENNYQKLQPNLFGV